jgi:hypothetical protein
MPWICNFHSRHSQGIRYHQTLSQAQDHSCGIPQGTQFGPIVFLAHVNGASEDTLSNSWAFVIDLNLIESRPICDTSTIQQDLNQLADWSEQNKMKLKPTKYKVMYTCFNHNHDPPQPLSISGHTFEVVSCAKALIVTFQGNLKWDTHLKHY